jgi:glycosyltransferase 2 family protein
VKTDTAQSSGGTPGFLGRHGGKVAVSVAIAIGFAWLLHKGALPLAPPAEALAHVDWWTVALYIAGWSVVTLVRALRWTCLLTPIARIPLRRIIAVSFVGFAAIALLPFRTGEAVRPVMIRKEGELSGWAATGTIAAERIIDGLVLCIMLLAGLRLTTPLSPLPDRIGTLPISPAIVPRAAYLALTVFLAAFAVMGIFYAWRDWARRTTSRVIGVVSPRLATWLADRIEHVASGLGFLPKLRFSVPFILVTAGYWLLNSACTLLLARSTGFPEFSFAQACVTTGVVALGILVPNAPGFFGAYQLSFYAALAVFYPPDRVIGAGAVCVFIVYSSQLLITIVEGAIGFLLDRAGTRAALSAGSAENLPVEALPE